ncbi:hypothetical protein LEP1GSC059_0529 [Leptospira noguchii serovar Panama str. CZ214]|uniref:Uncharacterized protein n=1 Tax=Leptospira noguchii serovar Panama str. CZ214 TaxID=1001595 RepID=T0H1X2_9LEPT|nr:hypothetical protein LEP1GSC059_0529 [Leptospira noguchii serovar Panama str. CZ214]
MFSVASCVRFRNLKRARKHLVILEAIGFQKEDRVKNF